MNAFTKFALLCFLAAVIAPALCGSNSKEKGNSKSKCKVDDSGDSSSDDSGSGRGKRSHFNSRRSNQCECDEVARFELLDAEGKLVRSKKGCKCADKAEPQLDAAFCQRFPSNAVCTKVYPACVAQKNVYTCCKVIPITTATTTTTSTTTTQTPETTTTQTEPTTGTVAVETTTEYGGSWGVK
jgi:hypothetical protein